MLITFGIFLILHSVVHILYAGQSWRWFELRPGLLWPDGSWMFSRLLGESTIRSLAGSLLILAALGLLVGGTGLLFKQDWWRPATMIAAALSSAIYLVFWDGKFQFLDAKGGVGLLINLAILVLIFVFKFPV